MGLISPPSLMTHHGNLMGLISPPSLITLMLILYNCSAACLCSPFVLCSISLMLLMSLIPLVFFSASLHCCPFSHNLEFSPPSESIVLDHMTPAEAMESCPLMFQTIFYSVFPLSLLSLDTVQQLPPMAFGLLVVMPYHRLQWLTLKHFLPSPGCPNHYLSVSPQPVGLSQTCVFVCARVCL